MARQSPKTILWGILARWLRIWAGFAQRQAEKIERLPVQVQPDEEAAAMPVAERRPGEAPAHWLERVNRADPPVHWLEHVRKRAPDLLDAGQPWVESHAAALASPPDEVMPDELRPDPERAGPLHAATPRARGLPLRLIPRVQRVQPTAEPDVVEHAAEEFVSEELVQDRVLQEPGVPVIEELPVSLLANESRVEEQSVASVAQPHPPPAPVPESSPVLNKVPAPAPARPLGRLRAQPVSAKTVVSQPQTQPQLQPQPQPQLQPQPHPQPQLQSLPQSQPQPQPQLQPLPHYRVQSRLQPLAAEAPRKESVPHLDQRPRVKRPARALPPAKAPETPSDPQPGATDLETRQTHSLPEASVPLSLRGRSSARSESARWTEFEVERVLEPPDSAPDPAHKPDKPAQAERAYWPQEQAVDRWPALPDQEPLVADDWEANLRAWQRIQRLDQEQRGHLWNELPF